LLWELTRGGGTEGREVRGVHKVTKLLARFRRHLPTQSSGSPVAAGPGLGEAGVLQAGDALGRKGCSRWSLERVIGKGELISMRRRVGQGGQGRKLSGWGEALTGRPRGAIGVVLAVVNAGVAL
jgi:hypothetical protein